MAAAGVVVIAVAVAVVVAGVLRDADRGGCVAEATAARPRPQTIELPACLSRLLEGRRSAEVFLDADTADVGPVKDMPGRDLGLVLATPELLGVMTFTYHGPPSEFYRVEQLVGADCKPIPHTFSYGGQGPNFQPYEDVRFARGAANYGVDFVAYDDDPQMQARLDGHAHPRLKITSATVAETARPSRARSRRT